MQESSHRQPSQPHPECLPAHCTPRCSKSIRKILMPASSGVFFCTVSHYGFQFRLEDAPPPILKDKGRFGCLVCVSRVLGVAVLMLLPGNRRWGSEVLERKPARWVENLDRAENGKLGKTANTHTEIRWMVAKSVRTTK